MTTKKPVRRAGKKWNLSQIKTALRRVCTKWGGKDSWGVPQIYQKTLLAQIRRNLS